jgi:protein subunit release factor A
MSDRAADQSRVKVVKKPRSPETIEAEITALERRIAELSNEMTKPEIARDITKLVKVNDEYERSQAQLTILMDEWERAETTAGSARKNVARPR